MTTLDDFGQLAKDRLVALIKDRNDKAAVVAAATGDIQGLIVTLRESSPNPQVKSLSAQIDQLNDQLLALETQRDEIIKPEAEQIQSESLSKVEGLTGQVTELDKQIRTAKKYLEQSYGEDAIADLPDMLSTKQRTGSGGGKRIRGFEVFVNGAPAEAVAKDGTRSSNLATAAKVIGCETTVVQQAFLAAQGTENSKEFKPRVEFTVEHDGKVFEVVARKVEADEADEDAA